MEQLSFRDIYTSSRPKWNRFLCILIRLSNFY